MDIDLENLESQFAVEVISLGAELAYRIRRETPVKILLKPDHSPVTLADLGIQAIAGSLLSQYFPESLMVGEETSDVFSLPGGMTELDKLTSYLHAFFPQTTSQRLCAWIDRGKNKPSGTFWTLDPIDGTKGFLRGGQYAIALAKIKDGQVVLSAMGCPDLELPAHYHLGKGVAILAVRGNGCWAASMDDLEDKRKWVRLEVSKSQDIHQARILDSTDMGHKDTDKNQRVRSLLEIVPGIQSMDSMTKHAVVAAGGAEIFFRTLSKNKPEYRDKIWDVAAGALAIEESGGRVTDLEGQPLDFGAGVTLANNPGLIATNGVFHEAVLNALKRCSE